MNKISILSKISIFEQNIYFWVKFQFLNKISIFEQNFNLLNKISIYWTKFQFLNKISIFEQIFNFWTQFGENIDFWTKCRSLVKMLSFSQKNRFLAKIWIFDQKFWKIVKKKLKKWNIILGNTLVLFGNNKITWPWNAITFFLFSFAKKNILIFLSFKLYFRIRFFV